MGYCKYKAFDNYVDYRDVNKIKQLYKSLDKIEELRIYGNDTVNLVFIDLMEALKRLEKELEREAIMYCLIEGYTYRQYIAQTGYSIGYVNKLIYEGLSNVSKILTKEVA